MCGNLDGEEMAAPAERIRAWLGAFCLLAMVMGGCESPQQAQLVEVKGVVRLDGQTLRSGSVMTTPVSGRGASGQIDEMGRFTLVTRGLGDGAVPGSHQVAVVVYEGPQSDAVNPEAELSLAIPSRYAQAATSGLTIEVQPDQVNDVTLELTMDNQ